MPSNTLKPLLRVKWDYWRERTGLIWAVTQTQTHRAPLSSELSPDDVSVAGPGWCAVSVWIIITEIAGGSVVFASTAMAPVIWHIWRVGVVCLCVRCGLLSRPASPRSRAGNTLGQTSDNGVQGPRAPLRQHIDTLIPTPHHTHQDPPVFYWKTLSFSLHLFLYSPEFAVFDFTARTLSCVVLCCVKYHVPGFKNINFRVNTTQMNI